MAIGRHSRLQFLSFLALLLVAAPGQNLIFANSNGSAPCPPGTVLLHEGFDELTPQFSQVSLGAFHTVNGTNVDVYTPPGYGDPCNGPESGHCIDMNGTATNGPNGNPVGQLQSVMLFPAGEYLLSFDLVGSQRTVTASTTVTMGNYTHTFTLAPQDLTSGTVMNLAVTVTTASYLTFYGDPNNGTIGNFLDNVVVRTAGSPIIVSKVPTSCKQGVTYSTISAAVAAAAPGSFVFVCPGLYNEQVVINKPLSLIGLRTGGHGELSSGDYPTIAAPPGGLASLTVPGGASVFPVSSFLADGKPIAAQIAVVGQNPVQISGFQFDGSHNDSGSYGAHMAGIYYQNGSGEVSDNILVNQQSVSSPGGETGFGIFVESGLPQKAQCGLSGGSTVNILGNTVMDFQTVAIAAGGASTNASVTANNVSLSVLNSSTAPNGIQFVGASGTISANLLQNITSGSGYASAGILLLASNGVSIPNNRVDVADVPVVTWTNASAASSNNQNGSADRATISGNTLTGSGFAGASGMEVCSNWNTITSNTIGANANAGVHLSSFCPGNSWSADAASGGSNYVAHNTISQTCAGIAVGGNANASALNSVSSAVYSFWLGDVCGKPNVIAPIGNSNILNTLGNAVSTANPGGRFSPADQLKRHF
jgi:hypothetical protein